MICALRANVRTEEGARQPRLKFWSYWDLGIKKQRIAVLLEVPARFPLENTGIWTSLPWGKGELSFADRAGRLFAECRVRNGGRLGIEAEDTRIRLDSNCRASRITYPQTRPRLAPSLLPLCE